MVPSEAGIGRKQPSESFAAMAIVFGGQAIESSLESNSLDSTVPRSFRPAIADIPFARMGHLYSSMAVNCDFFKRSESSS